MVETQDERKSSGLWLAIALLGLIGLAVTTYLTVTALSSSDVSCTIGGCNTVLSSKWSKIFGVPVSAFGMATYAAVLLGALHAHQSSPNILMGRRVVAVASGIGVVASIYLTIIELFVIKAICQYCVTSGVLILVAAILLIVTTRREGTAVSVLSSRWILRRDN